MKQNFSGFTYPKARKLHRCDLCGISILPDEEYVRWAGIHKGHFYDVKCHSHCRDATQHWTEEDWLKFEPGSLRPTTRQYGHDPSHPIGTCGKCGEEMVYNVLRLGPGGGFIHKRTNSILCEQDLVDAKEAARLKSAVKHLRKDQDDTPAPRKIYRFA